MQKQEKLVKHIEFLIKKISNYKLKSFKQQEVKTLNNLWKCNRHLQYILLIKILYS